MTRRLAEELAGQEGGPAVRQDCAPAWLDSEGRYQCKRALPLAPLAARSLYALVQERFPSDTPPERAFEA